MCRVYSSRPTASDSRFWKRRHTSLMPQPRKRGRSRPPRSPGRLPRGRRCPGSWHRLRRSCRTSRVERFEVLHDARSEEPHGQGAPILARHGGAVEVAARGCRDACGDGVGGMLWETTTLAPTSAFAPMRAPPVTVTLLERVAPGSMSRPACLRQSGHRPGRPVETASTTKAPEESLTRSTRTSIPGNSTSTTVLLATAGNTLVKRPCVPTADLGIHGTAVRALNLPTQCSGCHQSRSACFPRRTCADHDLGEQTLSFWALQRDNGGCVGTGGSDCAPVSRRTRGTSATPSSRS